MSDALRAIDVFQREEFQPGVAVEYPLDFLDGLDGRDSPDYVIVPMLFDVGECEIIADMAERHLLAAARDTSEPKLITKNPYRVLIGDKTVLVSNGRLPTLPHIEDTYCVMPVKDGCVGLAVLENRRVKFAPSVPPSEEADVAIVVG